MLHTRTEHKTTLIAEEKFNVSDLNISINNVEAIPPETASHVFEKVLSLSNNLSNVFLFMS